MDSKAFFKLSYGVYIISTSADNKEGGCVINTLTQVTSSPARLSIALNKENYTLKLIETSGTFSAAVLSDDVEMDLIRRFGFQCGKDVKKYDGIPQGRDSLNNPYPTEGVCARFHLPCCIHSMDVGSPYDYSGRGSGSRSPGFPRHRSHLFQLPSEEKQDHSAKGSFLSGRHKRGYGMALFCLRIYSESETLPPDFICPVCGKDASYFVKLVAPLLFHYLNHCKIP